MSSVSEAAAPTPATAPALAADSAAWAAGATYWRDKLAGHPRPAGPPWMKPPDVKPFRPEATISMWAPKLATFEVANVRSETTNWRARAASEGIWVGS